MKNFSSYIEETINDHLSKIIQVDVELKEGIYYIRTNYVLINTRYAKRQDIVRETILECLNQYLPKDFTNYKIVVNR
jgi:GTPase Era involved in 16S rRNA processing